MRPKRLQGRLTLRERLERNNATDRYWAAMAGKEPRAQTPLPPKRERVKRPVDGKPVVPLESAVNDAIYDAVKARDGVKLYRNNRGVAQYGNQQVRYGVGPRGGSDWIGYRRVFITTDMVGTHIAQFVAIEAKRPGERADPYQQSFLDTVRADGGCSGCATSAEEALAVIED